MAVRSSLARIGQCVPTSEGKVSFSYKLRRFLRAADLATAQAHRSWNGTWLPEEAVALIRPGQERETVRHALTNGTGSAALPRPVMVGDLQMVDIAGHLPDDILTKVDRMSMAHGLETRAPFLNHDLAAWALREPADHVVSRRGDLKVLLRAAARRAFGPAIADRAKQGFSIPIHAWTRGPLRATIDDLLSPSAVAAIGLLDAPRVATILDDHFSGRRSYGFEIWGLAVLSAWHRTRVHRPPGAPRPVHLLERRFPPIPLPSGERAG
jgi:asparagine synthase (glutamine-hydrolysing)